MKKALKIANEAKVCFGAGVFNMLIFFLMSNPYSIINAIVATLGFGMGVGMVFVDTFVKD